MKKIILVVGARPNFMKVAPLISEFEMPGSNFHYKLVHTGQHYDKKMSEYFFNDLKMPKPDIYLNVGSGSHAEQSAKTMVRFEKVCIDEVPDLVIVVGDVNSTMACAIVAKKLNIYVAHIEAGLRSYDRTMPEEINRIVTDSITDYYFTTCQDANDNLVSEGAIKENIFFVGNLMIDCLLKYKKISEDIELPKKLSEIVNNENYGLLTLHRPSNVDRKEVLSKFLLTIAEIAEKVKIIFPCHPRTLEKIEKFGLRKKMSRNIVFIEPIGYLQNIQLMVKAQFVMTDSGGIQEESTVLGIPCLTIRENTERPITIKEGTNILIGTDTEKLKLEVKKIIKGDSKKGTIPEKWDGKAAGRVAHILTEILV